MKTSRILVLALAVIFLFNVGVRAQTDYVHTDPATAATNTVTPTADVVPLTIDNGSSTYTSDLQQWKKNGVTVAKIDNTGDLILGSPSATNCDIVFYNLANSHSITLFGGAPAANRTYGLADIGKSGSIAISDASTTQTMFMQYNVDMTAGVGTSFTIFTVPANFNFICTEAIVVTTGISGFVSNGTFKIGTTIAGNELFGASAPPITAPTFKASYLSGISLPVVTAGNNVYCSIASSAVATNFRVNIFVKGFFYQ
ncbi:MAG TPA: hypothetical protein VG537_07705 [Candidatus Kapabacteria bacterium]|nr:hypothetical protein [Candidatus Kapabacteria bacterium]